MPLMVAYSSALILLAKCGLLEIVCDLFDVIVPAAVNIEVASEKMAKNYPDAALISVLTSKGKVNHPRLKRRGIKTVATAEAISLYAGDTQYIS